MKKNLSWWILLGLGIGFRLVSGVINDAIIADAFKLLSTLLIIFGVIALVRFFVKKNKK